MECLGCGAELPSKSRPCLFCGAPYRFQSPLRISPLHLRGYAVLAIAAVLLFIYRSFVLFNYNQAQYLSRHELKPTLNALFKGETDQARKQALRFHRQDWYSGFPAAIAAGCYYQDYARGEKEALESVEKYVQESQDRDPNFLGLYYSALASYHRQDYEAAQEQLNVAKEMLRAPAWRGRLDFKAWNRGFSQLERAIKKALAGETAQTPILFPRPNVPHPDQFEVVFKL